MGLCANDLVELTIPPHMAYGEHGDNNNVPGHATVIYRVRIIDQ